MDEEFSHNLSSSLISKGIARPIFKSFESELLKTSISSSIELKSPIMLAAGFDKNASMLRGLSRFGFSAIEVGTATPLAQKGNPKKRLFRLTQDKSIINCFGFNNAGLDTFIKNIKSNKECIDCVTGVNIGKNKDTNDISSDYIKMLEGVYDVSDYISINISSPNTKGLRDLQQRENLNELFLQMANIRNEKLSQGGDFKPIFVKISPDETQETLESIIYLIKKHSIDGAIMTNTTVTRDNLKSKKIPVAGGLSGLALKEKSRNILKKFHDISQGEITTISVGGIDCADEVIERLKIGASATQLYSALIYQGMGLVNKIKKDLDNFMKQESMTSISQFKDL